MLDAPKKRVRHRLGPHSRQHQLLAGVDFRSREAAHVGGNPTRVQKVLIERAARLTLYIELMDAEALEAGTMSERNSRQYLAWINALRLCLREIGIDEAKPSKAASIASIVSRHKAAAP
jgi:hypothetical protein